MARTLKAGLQAALNGGTIYWMVVLYPNARDNWGTGITQIVCGNIRTHSFGSETIVWSNRLLQISDLDQRGDPFASPLAEIPDASFEVADTAFTLDPVDYIGRRCEIRMGYGDTMSLETSDVMASGRLYDVTPGAEPFTLRFTLRGNSQLWNREVGTVVPETAHEKYRGKIYPVVYGDHTDSDAYTPLIVDRPNAKSPTMTLGLRDWKEFDELICWDERVKTGFRADADKYSVEAGNSVLSFKLFCTYLYMAMSETTSQMTLNNGATVTYYQSSGSDTVPATIVSIGDELMLITRGRSGNGFLVDRGYGGTIPAVHPAGSAVYQITSAAAAFRVGLSYVFWPKGYSGGQEHRIPGGVMTKTGKIENMDALPASVKYSRLGGSGDGGNYTGRASPDEYDSQTWDLIIEKTSVDGSIDAMYVLAKGESHSKVGSYISANRRAQDAYLSVGKDGEAREVVRFSTPSGVTDVPTVGAIYETGTGTANETQWKVKATNISGGSGTIDFYRIAGKGDPSVPFDMTGRGGGTGQGTIHITAILDSNTSAVVICRAVQSNVGEISESFNNIDGDDGETDLDITHLAPDSISELSDTRFHLGFIGVLSHMKSQEGTQYDNTAYRVGLRCDFSVNPLLFDFYGRGKGLTNPGSYFNGSEGDLLENPSTVIEDFLRQEVKLIDANLSEEDFDSTYTDRSSWKIAPVIYSESQ